MKRIVLLAMLISMMAFPVSAYAQEGPIDRIQYYGIEARINKDFSVSHKVTLIFDGVLSNIEYNFPAQISGFSVDNKYGESDCASEKDIMGTQIKCKVTTNRQKTNKTQLEFSFNTTDSIKKLFGNYRFETAYGISMPVDSLITLIYLPPTGILASTEAEESFFPVNGSTTTDGRHIILFWSRENVTHTDDIKYAVMYVLPGEPDDMNNLMITIIAVIALVALLGIGYMMRRSSKETVIKNIMPILNKEEKKVIDVLKNNGGKAMQKVIVTETDFSKAKVSRLIKDLKERNIIEIEPVGKKNRIKLKVNVGKVDEEKEQ